MASRALIAGAGVALAAAAFVAVVLVRSQQLPEGPVAVAWDKEACAHCHMLLSEPRFSVQLQAEDGSVLGFDDPGCYFAHAALHPSAEHAVYFHDSGGDGWIEKSRVAFVEVQPTPMGFGLAATGGPGALSLGQARELVLAKVSRGAP